MDTIEIPTNERATRPASTDTRPEERTVGGFRRRLPGLALSLVLAVTSGCLEREETIDVAQDGSVRVTHTIRGMPADLDDGRAHLPTEDRYDVRRTVENAGTDDEKAVLVATAAFPTVDAIPETFVDPDEPGLDRASALRARSRLHLFEERDGTHRIFVRRYEPRAWARYGYHHDRAFDDEVEKLLEGRDFDELAPEARKKVLGAVARAGRGKAEEWAAEAVRTVLPDDPERARATLAVSAAIGRTFEESGSPAQIEEWLDLDPEERDRRERAFHETLDGVAWRALTDALPNTPAALDQEEFLAAIAAERSAMQITEDLGDESFEVRVRLPGEILEHDADAIEDGYAVWRFDGKGLRDRAHTLTLHTRVARE